MKNVLHGRFKIAFLVSSIALSFFALDSAAFSQKIKSQKIKYKENRTNSVVKTVHDFDRDEFEILVLINAERAKSGLSQLILDDDAANIARDYSRRMADENFFGHFDADGNSVLERAKAARLKHWSRIGENLFSVENLDDFDAFAVKNWMESPTHRQNILDKDWTTTGIGIAKSASGEIFITQVFIKQ